MPQLRLRSGHLLNFRTFGNPSGHPIFHFHGIAGSSADASLYRDAPQKAGVFLICPDRPGLGQSDFQPNRKILDWPNNVAELADHLGLTSFSIIGVSGGAPYALACAHQIPHRIGSCGILSGAPPAHLIPPAALRFRATYFAIHNLPFLYEAFARKFVAWRSSHLTDRFYLPPFLSCHADAAVLRDPALSSVLADAASDGARQGYAGPALEGSLLAGDWGFRPEDLKLDKVILWHGNADRIVPVAIGRRMAAAIPLTRAKFYPGEGHYSLMVNYGTEILSTLL